MITDVTGAQVTVTTVVQVDSPAVAEARITAVWASFKALLQAGDIPGALGHLSPKIQAQFEAIFQALGGNLPAVAALLETPVLLKQFGDLSEAAIVRQSDGGSSLFFIYFRRDSTGRWLIEEM